MYTPDVNVLTSEPDAGETYSSWRDVGFDKNTPNSCIMHLTTGRCSERNSGAVATDALIRSLGLTTPGNIKYCPGTPRKIILLSERAFRVCYKQSEEIASLNAFNYVAPQRRISARQSTRARLSARICARNLARAGIGGAPLLALWRATRSVSVYTCEEFISHHTL